MITLICKRKFDATNAQCRLIATQYNAKDVVWLDKKVFESKNEYKWSMLSITTKLIIFTGIKNTPQNLENLKKLFFPIEVNKKNEMPFLITPDIILEIKYKM
jgi:hypothetical protein